MPRAFTPVLPMMCALAALASLPACAGAPPAGPLHVDAAQGYSLRFPAPVHTREGREGRVSFRIDAARTSDGARFEAAWFGFPVPLDAPDREALLEQVERGLAADHGTRVVSRTPGRSADRPVVDLVLDRADGKRGYHRVLYPSERSMLQVSAVGPQGGEWERALPPFWASLLLGPPALTAADLYRDRARIAFGPAAVSLRDASPPTGSMCPPVCPLPPLAPASRLRQ